MKIVIENTQPTSAVETPQEVCPLCKIGQCEYECDKCGITACNECVTGGHGTGEDMNICNECL